MNREDISKTNFYIKRVINILSTTLSSNQTGIFVNGRHSKSRTLQAALEQAYKNSMFVGRFPACVLYIEVSHASVDVNVHPAKTEVKFLNEKQVFDGVYYAVLSALEAEKDKAEIKLSKGTLSALSHKEAPSVPAPKKAPVPAPKAAATPSKDFFKTMPAESFRSSYSQSAPKTYSSPIKTEPKSTVKLSDSVKPVYQTRITLPETKPAAPAEKPAPAPVEAAKENAVLNGIDNVRFVAADVLKALDDLPQPDAIILDPPREGVNPKALWKILSYGVDNIVYVSCKPTSLARDIAAFHAAGYELKKACCVDMFPETEHVETVALLCRA